MKRIKIVNDKVYLYEGVKRVREIKTLKDYHNVMELREDYWARLDKFYVELDINKREVYIEDDFNGVGFLLNELENGYDMFLIKETEKAVNVRVETDFGTITTCLPKSALTTKEELNW